MNHIKQNVNLLQWHKDPVLNKYGLQVNPEMIQVSSYPLTVSVILTEGRPAREF